MQRKRRRGQRQCHPLPIQCRKACAGIRIQRQRVIQRDFQRFAGRLFPIEGQSSHAGIVAAGTRYTLPATKAARSRAKPSFMLTCGT